MREKFAFFRENNNAVLFNTITSDFYKITDKKTIEIFEKYFLDKIENSVIDEKLKKILENSKKCEKHFDYKLPSANHFSVKRLALVLTTNCNLRCKYCYANCGSYEYKSEKIMDKETLNNAIDYFFTNFKEVKTIQFFGGEPTLCCDKIQYAIRKIDNMFKNGEIEIKPQYGIVTNGINISDSLIELIKSHNIAVTLSVDGDKAIHDFLRSDAKGNGSFELIYQNYHKLLKQGLHKNISIETTYTNYHLEQDISLVDLIKLFKKMFNITIPHISPVNIHKSNELSIEKNYEKFIGYVRETIEYTLDNFVENNSIETYYILYKLITRIINKFEKKAICPIGLSTFSVSPDGKIDPCFMYTSKDELSYGEIGSNPDKVLEKAKEFNDRVNIKDNNKKCTKCFAKKICTSCLGYFNLSKDEGASVSSEVYCDIVRDTVREILLYFVKSTEHDGKWRKIREIV